jgi:uncharacterized coiled-coil protein SlyX
MPLRALTPAELAFLAAPVAAPDDLAARLTRRLAATLTARLRLPVSLDLQTDCSPAAAPQASAWHADAALATLWLTRRLGGRHVAGVAAFVPRSLIDTLDTALAEAWLDVSRQAALPAALAWRLQADRTQATLALRLPASPTEMTRWARGVIRHG